MPGRLWNGFRHTPISQGGSWLDSEENRALLQARIALFGKAGFLLLFGTFLFVWVVTTLDPSSARAWVPVAGATPREGYLALATALVLGGAWLLCRRGSRSADTLLLIDASVSILACLGASLPVALPEATADHKFRMLLAISNALIARAAIIPSRPGRTTVISVVAAMPAIILTGVFHDVLQVAVSAVWCAIAIAVATVTSWVIYGLHRKVREARQLGQYTLLQKLGEGGMGEVYRARHAMLRRPTAVKLLPPGKAGEAALLRFEREVQLTSILTHPNTVSIFDYGRTPDGIFYYAMEYLPGVNLDDLVREHGPQLPARVVRILRQLCGALTEAHGIGLIHRDIKPANIILCERGGVADVAKVVDFGLVRDLQADVALTSDSMIAGTPLYLSPEAITAPENVDARSDLYALGAVAYYLLTARHVFEGRNMVEVCSHHLGTPPARPSKVLGRSLPGKLEDAVLSCLEKDPIRRPQSARELDGLLAACSDLGSWSEEDASAWWRNHGQPVAGSESGTAGLTHALTVDLDYRARPFSKPRG